MPSEWHGSIPVQTFALRTNPRDAINGRIKKLMQLARYARLGRPGELLGWEDVEVVHFHDLYRALHELDRSEAPLQSFAEDF